jgi:signal transduction histidine kinase
MQGFRSRQWAQYAGTPDEVALSAVRLTLFRSSALLAAVVIVLLDGGPTGGSLWILAGLAAVLVVARFAGLPAAISEAATVAGSYAVLGYAVAVGGGEESHLGFLVAAIPAVAGFVLPPWRIALTGALAATAYVVGVSVSTDPGAPAMHLLAAIAAATAFGLLVATNRATLRGALLDLSARRREQRAGILDDLEAQRRRVTAGLYATAMQDLMFARQELAAAPNGVPCRVARASVGRAGTAVDEATTALRAAPGAPPTTSDEGVRRAAIEHLALARIGICVALTIPAFAVDTPTHLLALLAALTLWQGRAVAWSFSPNWRKARPDNTDLVVGVTSLAALLAMTGGHHSEVLTGIVLVPIAVALQATPSRYAIILVGVFLAILVGSLGATGPADHDGPSHVLTGLVALSWTALIGALVVRERSGMEARILALDAERAALIALLRRDELTRRLRAAHALETTVTPTLRRATAAAAADHADAERLVFDALGDLRAIAEDLHSPALDHGGLPAAIAALASGRDDHVPARVALDTRAVDEARGREEAVLSLLRHLLADADRREAVDVAVDLASGPADHTLRLTVRDDGGRASTAQENAILRACRERVEAMGGDLLTAHEPGRGREVIVHVPCLAPTGNGAQTVPLAAS